LARSAHPACAAEQLRIANVGSEPAVAMVLMWAEAEPGVSEGGSCNGPTHVVCTGLIRPGAEWIVGSDELPPRASSAAVFSLTHKTMADVGAEPASEELVSKVLCSHMLDAIAREDGDAAGVMCGEYRRFRLAYATGLVFAGVPLSRAYGGAIQVEVDRACGDAGALPATYRAPSGRDVLTVWPADGLSYQALGGIRTYVDRPGTVLTIQNAGTEATSVALRFRPHGDCQYDRICRLEALQAGQSAAYVAEECVGPDWFGSVVATGQEPLAVTADDFAHEPARSRSSFAARSAYDVDGDWLVDSRDVAALSDALGARPGDSNWNRRADIDGNDVINDTDRLILEANLCGTSQEQTEPPPAERRPSTQVALPSIGSLGADRTPCQTTIAVQNVGDVDTGVVLLTWPDGGADPGSCTAPTGIECSGLIRPGGSWHLPLRSGSSQAGGESGASSGMLFSFSAELAVSWPAPGSDAILSDDRWFTLMCEELRSGVLGDCTQYARFKRAFDVGGSFAGVPLDKAAGAPIAANVRRDCSATTEGAPLSASYAGLGANAFGVPRPDRGSNAYYAPGLYQQHDGLTSVLHLQNAGSEPATTELWVMPEYPCGTPQLCDVWTIDPGESVAADVCGRDSGTWRGSATVYSNRPMGVTVETTAPGLALAYVAHPARIDHDATGRALLPDDRTVLYGLPVPDPAAAWDDVVRVQNLSAAQLARVRVELRDSEGAVLRTLDDTVCPLGSKSFTFEADGAASDGAPGSIRVESLPLPDDRSAPPAPVAAVLESYARRTGASAVSGGSSVPGRDFAALQRQATAETLGAYALPLAPASETTASWPVAGGLDEGIGVVAVPGLSVSGSAPADQLAIADLVRSPGWTDVAVILRDQNGVLKVSCTRIGAGTVETIDLGRSPLLMPGFRGSAVVSAAAWQHMALDRESGATQVNLLGLAAAALQRSGASGLSGSHGRQSLGAAPGTPLRTLPWPAGEPVGDLCANPTPPLRRVYLPGAFKHR